MALQFTDTLTNILGTMANSTRAESLAWVLAGQRNEALLNQHPNWPNHRDLIAQNLKADSHLATEVKKCLASRTIPDRHLNWIDGSLRQSLWIEKTIPAPLNNGRSLFDGFASGPIPIPQPNTLAPRIPYHLVGKNRSIGIIDYWTGVTSQPLDEWVNKCQQLQIYWEGYTKLDPLFKWLDDADAERKRDFFWGWLGAKDYTLTLGRPKFQNHEEVLIFFDDARFSTIDKDFLSKNAKKTWNQREARESSKDKKQCNLIISRAATEKLKKLAQKHGLTRSEIIELLIESEAKNEIYISGRLQRVSLLKTSFD